MKLKSMTGFGRAETTQQGRTWTVEVRSVNNRYLDAKIKLPRDYGALEDRIRKVVGEYHHRGRVDLAVTVSGDFSDLTNVRVNAELATAYKQALGLLADKLDLAGDINLQQLMMFPDVLSREQLVEDLEVVWQLLEPIIREALGACQTMRSGEAATLAADLSNRVSLFSALLDTIGQSLPDLLTQREQALKERLDKLLGMVDLDPMRLAQEVAILADKMDVTEELVRLRSHIQQFNKALTASAAVGRKLDFLIQEFLREVNTIASKINDAEVAHKTVELKSELEKMREQVQNIE